MNHRLLQRLLFRMQLDPGFDARLRARDPEAIAGIPAAELALLLATDPAGVSADRGGKRKAQVLGNLLKELVLSATLADRHGRPLGAGFFASEPFHEALREERPLPLALLTFALEEARGDRELEALLALEGGMMMARRIVRTPPTLAPGEAALSEEARLLRLPGGTMALAEALAAGLGVEGDSPLPGLDHETPELVLLVRRPAPGWSPNAEVTAERVDGATRTLVEALRRPRDRAARADLAAEIGVEADELEGFVRELEAEGVVRLGAG